MEINRASVGSSLAHRYSQVKLDVITSLAEGFNNAVYFGSMQDFSRQEGVKSHYFAYPINYNGNRNYVFCRAMQDANKSRLYVHEVFLADNIEKGQYPSNRSVSASRRYYPLQGYSCERPRRKCNK